MFLSLVKIFLLATEEFHWSRSLSFLKTLLQLCKSSQFKKAQMPQSRKEKSLNFIQNFFEKSSLTLQARISSNDIKVHWHNHKVHKLQVIGRYFLEVHGTNCAGTTNFTCTYTGILICMYFVSLLLTNCVIEEMLKLCLGSISFFTCYIINPSIFCTCRNRAVHGDIVVVELLHKSQWKGRSNSLKSKDEGKIMNCVCSIHLYTCRSSIEDKGKTKFHEPFFSH